jgi:hypothetical protein
MNFKCITLRVFDVNVDHISIGNFTLYDTQNDYHQWYFQKADRVREIVKDEDGAGQKERLSAIGRPWHRCADGYS